MKKVYSFLSLLFITTIGIAQTFTAGTLPGSYKSGGVTGVWDMNNDGLNDYFSVFGLIPNVQKINNMQIFDRWGKMIFEQNNFVPNEPNTGWDGTQGGTDVDPMDAYVYVIKVKDIKYVDRKNKDTFVIIFLYGNYYNERNFFTN